MYCRYIPLIINLSVCILCFLYISITDICIFTYVYCYLHASFAVYESLSDMSAVCFEESSSDRNTPANSSLFLVVRPAYPLIPELERDWPVSISLDTIPFCLTRGTYNVLTVVLSSALAFSLFLIAWVFSNLVNSVIVYYLLHNSRNSSSI